MGWKPDNLVMRHLAGSCVVAARALGATTEQRLEGT